MILFVAFGAIPHHLTQLYSCVGRIIDVCGMCGIIALFLEGRQRSESIIVVDRRESILSFIQTVAVKFGYLVELSYNGEFLRGNNSLEDADVMDMTTVTVVRRYGVCVVGCGCLTSVIVGVIGGGGCSSKEPEYV